MKQWAIAVAVVVGVLAGCSETTDEPTQEQVADGIRMVFNDAYPPGLDQRIDLEKWDKLTYTCEPLDGDVKKTRCTTNGEITIAGYKGGVQTAEGPQPVAPTWVIDFEKRSEGWVPFHAESKG